MFHLLSRHRSQDIVSHVAPVYNWVDVTQEFGKATKELGLGELLHDNLFGLFEAMSAIEMMDPKMDAGMRCNRQAAKPMDFEAAVKVWLGVCTPFWRSGKILKPSRPSVHSCPARPPEAGRGDQFRAARGGG